MRLCELYWNIMTKEPDLGLNMLRDGLLDGASRVIKMVEVSKGRSATARRIISFLST